MKIHLQAQTVSDKAGEQNFNITFALQNSRARGALDRFCGRNVRDDFKTPQNFPCHARHEFTPTTLNSPQTGPYIANCFSATISFVIFGIQILQFCDSPGWPLQGCWSRNTTWSQESSESLNSYSKSQKTTQIQKEAHFNYSPEPYPSMTSRLHPSQTTNNERKIKNHGFSSYKEAQALAARLPRIFH